jgi:peptidoglycan/LPS O-acetylase OafA/YrhL
LIGGILLDQRTATNYYAVFYLRRFLRIVPLYALLVLPGILVLGLGWQTYLAGHSFANQSVTAIWFCPFFLQNIAWALALNIPAYLAPTWSVAVEEQFYLLLPPLIRNADRKKLFQILWLAILVAPVLRGLLIFAFGEHATVACYVLLPCRWDSLLLGVVGAFAMREAALLDWLTDRLRHVQIFWLLTAAASLGFLFASQGHLDARMAFLGYTVIDAFFACTLWLAVTNPAGSLHHVLSWPAFKPIAVISYGLYLIQSPMQAVIESLFRFAHLRYVAVSWPAVGVALVSLAATFLAAALSWKFFESRLIRLGHQHAYQPANTVRPGKNTGES